MIIQTNFELFRSPGNPIPQSAFTPSPTFQWPTAVTSNTFELFPGLMPGSKVFRSRWVCVWNPNTMATPSASTFVRLVSCDDGPTNIAELARVPPRPSTDHPCNDGILITTQMQALWNRCQTTPPTYKQIGHQVAGNGVAGPMLYASWVEIMLEY